LLGDDAISSGKTLSLANEASSKKGREIQWISLYNWAVLDFWAGNSLPMVIHIFLPLQLAELELT
jgi:hypothetical protein